MREGNVFNRVCQSFCQSPLSPKLRPLCVSSPHYVHLYLTIKGPPDMFKPVPKDITTQGHPLPRTCWIVGGRLAFDWKAFLLSIFSSPISSARQLSDHSNACLSIVARYVSCCFWFSSVTTGIRNFRPKRRFRSNVLYYIQPDCTYYLQRKRVLIRDSLRPRSWRHSW